MPSQVTFNPKYNDVFVSVSLDQVVRLFQIDKTKPIHEQKTSEPNSAAVFSPNGNFLVVGLLSGICYIFEYSGKKLRYHSKIDCKNRRGVYRSGRKVAGICFLNNQEFLVATNDSRIRLINIENCSQEVKFKGHVNDNLQMMPSFEKHYELIASGSEDGSVYVWNSGQLKELKRKSNPEEKVPHETLDDTLQSTIGNIAPSGSILTSQGARQSNPFIYAYKNKKEKRYEHFSPFQGLAKPDKKKKTKTITNVAVFAPMPTVKAA